MSDENVLLECPEPGIYCLTINRPEVLNALNAATLADIGAGIARVAGAEDARVLLVTGAGDRAFVAGADIAEMRDLSPLQARAFSRQALEVFTAIEALPVPAIAVVNGFALGGGCELAMSCDWALAGERAVFGQPEVNLGVIPGFGGTQRLVRLVGRAVALELVTTGRRVKAREAVELGLANHVYPDDELRDRALEMAREVASKGPVAIRLAKEAVQRGQDLGLEAALALEGEMFGLCFASADQAEGMSAFLDKRQARFTGR